MRLFGFIRKYSILFYFLITFTISWGGMLSVIGLDGFLGITGVSEELMPFLYISTLLGPSVAGILMTAIVHGKNGFAVLGGQLFRGKLLWYVAAFLTAPILLLVSLLMLMLFSGNFLPGIFASKDQVSLLISGIVAGLMVGIFEELGWTAFVIPQLRKRFNVLATGLIVGFMWGLWHLPLFIGSIKNSGDIPQILFLCILLFSFLPACRVLMVWLYDRSRSIVLPMLMHAGLTGSILVLPPLESKPGQIATYDMVFAVFLWITVAVIAVIHGGRLSTPFMNKNYIICD